MSNHNLNRSKVWMLPSRMRRVINLLGQSVGTIEEVIKHNTLIPLASRFIRPEDTESIVSHFIEGPRGGLASKVGMAGEASGWSKHRLLRCVECLKEDIGSCGKPFWRRDHLLPGLLFCGKHRVPLQVPCEVCANYASFSERTLHAGHHCGCGLTPLLEATQMTDAQSESEIGLARIASQLLDSDYLPTLDFRRVAKETSRAAVELGLVRDGESRYARIREFLSDSPFNALLRRTGIFAASRTKLTRIFNGDSCMRHPLSALTLLTSLVGRWQTVELRVTASNIDEEASTRVNLARKVRLEEGLPELSPDRIARDFQRYKELHAIHPGLNHTQLRGRFSTKSRRYLTVERVRNAGVEVLPRPKQKKSDSDLVDELIAHIKNRSLHLLATRYPERITGRVLMETFRRPKVFEQKGMKARLPRAYETLTELRETDAAWRERMKREKSITKAQRRKGQESRTKVNTTESANEQGA
ncbi:TniQ family protein [Burkholderia sp. WP9]|uniref:TniQ family protein n=1 Tax=Burkholderia sp. WP9 TaxID=1500263 RepID=UPI00115F9457|nr:TniQ family protein [Burkholderia sp. WP9]